LGYLLPRKFYSKQIGLFSCGFALVHIRKIDAAFAVTATAFFYKQGVIKHPAYVNKGKYKNYRNDDALYHGANLTIICIYTIVL
jgi:hypothetical protein